MTPHLNITVFSLALANQQAISSFVILNILISLQIFDFIFIFELTVIYSINMSSCN